MSFWDSVKGVFGGSSGGGGGSGGFDWTGALIAGIGAYSSSRSSDKNQSKNVKETGREARRTEAFGRELDYYYGQLDKMNKRKALDSTYNAFSRLGSYAPQGYTGTPMPVVPNKPKPE